MTRVLLSGATGFVGAHALRVLAARADVQVDLVLRRGTAERIGTSPALGRIHETDDLFDEDRSWWAQRCDGVDVVLHLAWYAEPGRYLVSPRNLDCVRGTLALAQGASDAGVSHFVGAGTCFEYDLSAGHLDTRTPLLPTTVYAVSKAAVYSILSAFFATEACRFSWGRIFYLHGDGEDARRLVPYVRDQLARGEPVELTSGEQVRDFLRVDRAAEMLVEVALGDADAGSGAFNVCSGVPVTVRELAEGIADEFGRRDLLRFGARPANLTDPPMVVGVPGF
ncbi:MAG TPA: NAD-dependent epimerase/dehydratase family protein [Pseudomonadales bacterium]|nr:NAD-dependent epimerase/dehydratase family protein [Pseudomonadales bacterium]